MPMKLKTCRPVGRSAISYDAQRAKVKPSRRWLSTKAWRDRRERQLAEQPLCCMCLDEGAHVPATVADHVVPHRENAVLFWHGELQSLCASHHSKDKQREEYNAGGG